MASIIITREQFGVNNVTFIDNCVIPEDFHGLIFVYLYYLHKTGKMKPSAPSKYVWIFGLILGISGIIGHYVNVEFFSAYNYTLLLAGFVLLAIGTSFKQI